MTFVERQIAHVWASSMVSIAMLFLVEMILGLPVLTLSPILAISSGMIFLVKAGMLTGRFYFQAAALFATAAVMAWLQREGSFGASRYSGSSRRVLLYSRVEVLPPTATRCAKGVREALMSGRSGPRRGQSQ